MRGLHLIRTPQGDAIPFETVARMNVKQGLRKATHINYQRAAEISAEANKSIVEPGKVLTEIETNALPALMKKYPGRSYTLSGLSNEEAKMARSMTIGFALSMFAIYALLAVPTKSYLQPLIIMGVIPFGIIGASRPLDNGLSPEHDVSDGCHSPERSGSKRQLDFS